MSALRLAGPARLRAAVEALPEAREPWQPPREALEGLRRQLLALSMEDLGRFRMRRRAQDALPLLLVGREDPELEARALALACRELDSLSWSSLARLLGELYPDPALRQGVLERLGRSAPRGPRWLARHGREALGAADPALALAQAALRAGLPICRLLADLELGVDTRLGRATLQAAIAVLDLPGLAAQPWADTLSWVARSSAAPADRRALLTRIDAGWLSPPPPPALWIRPGSWR